MRSPPPATFQELQLCVDEDTAAFCDKSCSMPLPAHCDPESGKSFGTCAPAVQDLCDEIAESRDKCVELKQHVTAKEAAYDAMEVGHLTCRVAPDAPFAKAAYAQVKYEEAYTNWVDATNDATEVCTIGHALWVHNLGLFQSHYEKIRATTERHHRDVRELSKHPDSKLDVNEVIVDTESILLLPSLARARGEEKELGITRITRTPPRTSRLWWMTSRTGVKIVRDSKVGKGSKIRSRKNTATDASWCGGSNSATPPSPPWRTSFTTLEIATPSAHVLRRDVPARRRTRRRSLR